MMARGGAVVPALFGRSHSRFSASASRPPEWYACTMSGASTLDVLACASKESAISSSERSGALGVPSSIARK